MNKKQLVVACIMVLIFLTGCNSGKSSVKDGKAKYSVPFVLSKEQQKESSTPLIYNEEALIQQLKGKTKEEVIKVLGNPAVETPYKESEQRLEYWWYSLPEAGIFVYPVRENHRRAIPLASLEINL